MELVCVEINDIYHLAFGMDAGRIIVQLAECAIIVTAVGAENGAVSAYQTLQTQITTDILTLEILTHTPIITNTTTDVTLDEKVEKTQKELDKENKEFQKQLKKELQEDKKKLEELEKADKKAEKAEKKAAEKESKKTK